LNLQGDRYRGENILIHEFSHCIAGQGLRRLHPDFNDRLRALYEDAKAKGLWARTYAMENPAEYWAEAVQSWFDCNRQSRRGEEPDGVHNHVDTREELIEYDPGVAALIEEMLGRSEWRYSTYLERHPEAAGDR
jgi:alpha-glucosidase